jgi:hydrogenase maturation protease
LVLQAMAHVSELGGSGQQSATIAIIGCGNPNRSDDGVGPEVVQALASRAVCKDSRVRLLDAGTDGMAVMFAARGCRTLIIVDACRTGSAPGAVFEVPGAELEQRHQPSLTLHDFRWDHALFAGRRIFAGAFPEDVTVLLIEIGTTALGIGLSPCVIDAADTVADRIEALVRLRLPETAATQ